MIETSPAERVSRDLTERVTLAIGALRGIREHSWIMGGGTATCRRCGRVVDVVPYNAEGHWNAGTVFCNETRSCDGDNLARLVATIDKIADDSGLHFRA